MKHRNSICMHCSGCAAVCSVNAIIVYENFVDYDEKICTKCGNCIKICPVGAWTEN